MSQPLSFLDGSSLPEGISLGEHFGALISQSSIKSLVDCFSSSPDPAIFSPDLARPPLTQQELRKFIVDFALPHSSDRGPFGPNDRIMVVLPSGPESAVALLALSSYHTCAPVNSSCTLAELKEDAMRLRVKAIVTTRDIAKRLQLIVDGKDLDYEVLFLQPRSLGPAGLFDLESPNCEGSIVPPPSLPQGLDDVSLILHTSGTSGKKKVVRYRLLTLLVGTWCVVHSWELKPSDINLNMMPLFHVGGIVRNLLAPVLSGGSAIMCLGFDPAAFWNLSLHLRVTWYYAAPTVHHEILSAQPEDVVPCRDLNVRFIGNAAGGLLPSLALRLRDTFGAVVLPSYGMTECMPIATPLTNYQLERPGCSGIACGPYLSIRDPADIERELAVGKTGAVCVRGLPTFDGYETHSDNDVPLDASMFSCEGWFESGDMGYMDEDGYLYITGRSKEIINKGGEVISPFEIEEAVVTVAKEYVKTVLAFSVEHDVLQETIGIVVVPVPSRPRLSLQQLCDMLRGHLHPSKWPFVIVYMEAVPKNSAGKPLRISLGKRLGIGQLTNAHPILHRHFEARAPDNQHSISEPIPCSLVSIDASRIEKALKSAAGAADAVVRCKPDGSMVAYVALHSQSSSRASDIYQDISSTVHGYELPDKIHTFSGSLIFDASGSVDFTAMDNATLSFASGVPLSASEHLVRGIVAELLDLDPMQIDADSDFFLLGGSSLLLGKLAYQLRQISGTSVGVTELFAESTISGMASLIEDADHKYKKAHRPEIKQHVTSASSSTAYSEEYDFEQDLEYSSPKNERRQTRSGPLVVQAIPFLFFYPFKAALTWCLLLFILSHFSDFVRESFWKRMWTLAKAVFIARLTTRTVAPLTAIAFKWIVIGRYRPGLHRMWSSYYLRWWIVNQSLRIAGRGIFAMHPSLVILYYRLLGANIGKDVRIDEKTTLLECDLITLQDGCRIDTQILRGFSVERNGYFRLEPVTIGKKAFVNAATFISPGSNIPDGCVYGPHASSYDQPSPKSFAAYSRTLQSQPAMLLKVFVAWPIIMITTVASYIPWVLSIYGMIHETQLFHNGLSDLQTMVYWFASPERVLYHGISRVARALCRPLIRLVIGIVVKRLLGLNTETSSSSSQRVLLRRYINGILLSQESLKEAFSIIGTHYEVVSVVFRAMGAKVGQRVYWPGSGIYCPDPELLEIGDDVVFGSRSSLITTDRLGSGKIILENGAMIADRVILLPGTRVGKRTVMGSGALGKRGGKYEDGSVWMGNENGEAVCFNKGSKEPDNTDTCTPFGRAFYQRKASYFVFPYFMVASIGILSTTLSAVYWSISAVAAAQLLRHAHIHMSRFRLFDAHWFQLGILYGLVVACFIAVLVTQAILSILWVILTKWVLIGRRRPGAYDWDQSSYCQRWQLHLTLSRICYKGYGNGGILGALSGSVYIVWYFRALGAKIGRNCAIWAGGRLGLMTEPDLIELGDNVNLDDCSVVAHINSRGRFSLNRLKIGNGCAMRSGSRLLSGASMEDDSMLVEHTLLTSGDVADAGQTYGGWPGKPLRNEPSSKDSEGALSGLAARLTCPACGRFPKESTVSPCGHLFCQACIARSLSLRKCCPICFEPSTMPQLRRVHLSFISETSSTSTAMSE